MEIITLNSAVTVQSLIRKAFEIDEPITVLDGDFECLIAMSPAVFERVLFDTHLLNCEDRESMWL